MFQEWEIDVILWLQRLSPTLDVPFKALTFLGEEDFLLLLLPFLYWCWMRKTGARLFVLFLLAFFVGTWTKVTFNQPRPFEYDPRVQKIFETVGNGFPSNHTVSAVALWGYLAFQLRRTWVWIGAGALIVLIPLSRVYLGLHFITDILGGYLIGGASLLLYFKLGPATERWLARNGLIWQLGITVALSIVMMLVLPVREEIGVTTVALLLGVGVGLALENHWVRFEAGGTWGKRMLRFLLGVAGLLALRVALKAAFSHLEPEQVFRFIRYSLLGLWPGFVAPWIFVKLRLAVAESE